jgi:hypothetical protein
MAEFDTAQGTPPSPQTMAEPFQKLPPCGLLPKSALQLDDFRSDFFPPLFTLDAVPVPIEQLDLAIREAAPMAPMDMAVSERVRLLVPVSQASWEPRLLHQDVIDPEFQLTLDRFLLERSRSLGGRQGLRNKAALLAHALDGQQHVVQPYSDDPLALEPESLSPWGPAPPGGGHRSSLVEGRHEHLFDGASTAFRVNANESVFAWVCLDPDHPPQSLMLQWHTADGWEHRAFWGEDLMSPGAKLGSAGYFTSGGLPTPGEWTMLQVPAAALGLDDQDVDGMAFSLHGGRAAYGMAGALLKGDPRMWFGNFLPLGARAQGDEAWDLLTDNDLWAPFVPEDGVVPSLPELVISAGGGIFGADGEALAQRALPESGFNVLYPQAPGWRGHIVMFPATPSSPTFQNANGTDTLTTWVYLDELTPPRAIFAYFICAGINSDGSTRGFALRLGFWGESRLPELFKAVPGMDRFGSQILRVGALPQSGTWTQLSIPQPVRGSTAEGATRLRIVGVAVMVFDGSIAFSDMDIHPAATEAIPTPPSVPVWPMSRDGAAPTPGFAPYLNAKLALQSGLGALTPTASSRIGTVQVYTELANDPALARLSHHERSQLQLRGLRGFAGYLRKRVDRADDITDFGFAHMQVDMHRIRQMMMSTTDASRLAISPALAAIAKSDSALTVQSQIKEYLTTVKGVTAPLASVAVTPVAAPRAVVPAAKSSVSAGFSSTQFVQQQVTAQLIQKPAAPPKIIYAMPVIGLSEVRTTAIADRLKDPPSTDARNHALANRHRSVSSLLGLLNDFMVEDSGAVPAMFQDFAVFGLDGDPFLPESAATSKLFRRPLTDFRSDTTLPQKLLTPPPLTGTVDEGRLFTQTVALSDNTIATLRQLEGRLTIYREAITRCEQAEEDLKAHISQVAQRLRTFGDALAEARHDVSVTRALIAEELARIEAVNARRAKILAEEVKFLAYVRPRETSNVLTPPHRVVDPALQEAPVPACLRDHHDVPDELEDMLKVVREAPAAWFVSVPKLIDRLDRMDLLLRTLKASQLRTPLLAARTPATRVQSGKLGGAMFSVIQRQSSLVTTRLLAINQLNLTQLAQTTWKHVRDQAQAVVSMGDLIDGEHGKTLVAQRAANEFDRIGAVCTCLHAEFSGVAPAIRLDWAEMLSEFDAAPNLRSLGNLPRWAEIDSIDRRQMQAYVDWLFAQTEPGQSRAIELVNDIVRMCLLLASHAPVGRIITGNLPRPVTAVRPGVRIPLLALDPSRLRVGMQAVLYRANQVVARAVVEDLGQGEVSARVMQTSAAQVDLDVDVRVHFDHASVVSASRQRSSGLFKR